MEFDAKNKKEYVSIVDRNYSYVSVSSSYLKDKGLEYKDVVGRKLEDIWEKETVENVIKPFIDKAFAGDIVQTQSYFSFSSKRKKHYQTSYMPIYDSWGKIEKVAIVTRDLTKDQFINAQLYTDALTKANNRKAFYKDLTELSKGNKKYYVFSLDLDNFKPVNDKYGHHIGDKMLIKTASTFESLLKDDQKLYRPGGDEFAILGQNASSKELENQAQKIIDTLKIAKFNKKFQIGVSIGIINVRKKKWEKDKIVKEADILMYKSKKNGKNGYVLKEI